MEKKYSFLIAVIALVLILGGIFGFKYYSDYQKKNALTLTSISPTSVPAGSMGLTLRVYGKNLKPEDQVFWNGTSLNTETKYIQFGFLTADVPTANLAQPGSFPITIRDPSTNKTSNSAPFSVGSILK
jgi:hypothetical protein